MHKQTVLTKLCCNQQPVSQHRYMLYQLYQILDYAFYTFTDKPQNHMDVLHRENFRTMLVPEEPRDILVHDYVSKIGSIATEMHKKPHIPNFVLVSQDHSHINIKYQISSQNW